MPEFQVEIRLRLEADSQHDAALWASRALDAEPFQDNPAIGYLDCHVQAVELKEGEQ